MSLSLAYDIARAALSTTSSATSVVSRNVQNAGDPTASRKSAEIASGQPGVRLAGIRNAADGALFDSVIEKRTSASELEGIVRALDQLDDAFGDPELERNPAALIADLQGALQAAASSPGDDLLAKSAIESARTLAQGLNEAAGVVTEVRNAANEEIAHSVERLTSLLTDFEAVNNEIVTGTYANADVTDQWDARNRILGDIAELVDVSATLRSANDMVLFLANGATLFETVPRRVLFEPGAALAPGVAGNPLIIDGVPVSGSGFGRLGGSLGAALQVRDEIAVTFGRQLDEIARGLIVSFAESDRSAVPVLPDRAGLFTYSGGPSVPGPVAVDGLAAAIRVNASVDPRQGGDVTLLRDGGISDPGNPAYVYNSTGAAGFGSRLR
jgi:flagellar hook-associated protein 1 FlgK